MNKLLILALIGLLAISALAQDGQQATDSPQATDQTPQDTQQQNVQPKQEAEQQQQNPQPKQAGEEGQQQEQQQEMKNEVVVDDDEDRVAIMEEWEKHMQDFIPDEMLTFEIDSKKEELFMEDITVPTQMRGAFFVSYFSDEKIDFVIRDPNKHKVFHKLNKREGIFNVNATTIGTYEFIFSNIRGKDKKSVTFALDVHNTTETHLSHHDLDPVEKKLEHVASGIKDYLNEQRFSSRRQITQLESIQSAHSRLLIFSVVEIAIVVFATAWQIYYIKKILDNKRIV
ncbi:emp24/gp25L/p24 family protein (macronuclear) [Tetrahymena thermophila SB210]|uniref:Emp24/gp25L/p24 family protein n=1 Tax=Tetrahymena thermophila (strain SB210) TaxID=312017 RepID=I7LUF8_TETTS|nr:emp24/gp25L/p24 family protein [Tetrahymena thermophila SB210]EAR92966.1 emp24/gp25L/p24 family protein [Tetrahymena thermophila SB210]|eukprot:XP_001013211.1 emp24/gp25L/p24 family protein [Tetrahymena thermophila SB210]